MTKLWLTADQPPPLTFGQSVRVLAADVNQLTSLANQFLTDVRLSATAGDRLVSQNPTLIDQSRIFNGNEEPFTLSHERFVASTVPLAWLHPESILEASHGRRLQCLERSLHR
jgi:hypothetical protein